jgi:hypothetical protein
MATTITACKTYRTSSRRPPSPGEAHVPQPLKQERHGDHELGDHELGDHELHVLEVGQTAMEGERRKGKRRQKRSLTVLTLLERSEITNPFDGFR